MENYECYLAKSAKRGIIFTIMRQITLFICLCISTLAFSQKAEKEKINHTQEISQETSFFDISIFKPKTDNFTIFTKELKKVKTTSKMPVFKATGFYKLRIIKPDSLKKQRLKIIKPN